MRTLALIMAVAATLGPAASAQTRPDPALSPDGASPMPGEVSVGQLMTDACKTDYHAHCRGRNPSAAVAAACLSQYYVNLSSNCRMALDNYDNSGSTLNGDE